MEEMAWRRKTREKLEAAAESGAGTGADKRAAAVSNATYDPTVPVEDRCVAVLRIAVAKALDIEIGPWDSETTAVHDELLHAAHDLLLGLDEMNAAEEILAKDKSLAPPLPAPLKPPPGMDMFQEMAWRKEQKAKAAAAAAAPRTSLNSIPKDTKPSTIGPASVRGAHGNGTENSSSARKTELEKLPAFKLKAAAQAAGVQPLPIGVPARTKEETIALILELEGAGGAGSGGGAQPVLSGSAAPSPKASSSMSRSVSKPGRGAVEDLVE
jgi:hypothetical protein